MSMNAGLNLNFIFYSVLVLLLAGCGGGGTTGSRGGEQPTTTVTLNNIQSLGQQIYFDSNLSSPAGQSCASCHLPTAGFADPDSHFPVSEGVITGLFGNRNSPTTSYASTIPDFQFNGVHFLGGQFLDGRASTLEDQAKGPFLNPLEMNNTKEGVVEAIRFSSYASDFESVFGIGSLDNVDSAYELIAKAIAEFERSAVFSPFTAKFDAVRTRGDVFTLAEQRGFDLFRGKADCIRCHSIGRGQHLFSDFTYHNLGVPANSDNPFYALDSSFNPDGSGFVDLGLGGVLNDVNQNGKFRVPTLRNIAKTGPYMHNGIFNTLQQVMVFYNTRDTNPLQDPAEVDANKDNLIGNLQLTQSEIDDVIAFLNTLTDGYIQ